MSQIKVMNLTFSYNSSYENIFENTSFEIDTDWKLGFIGRNGRGKTTFLKLLQGKYDYSGTINASVDFDYFPFKVDMNSKALEVVRNIIAPFTKWEARMQECVDLNIEDALSEYGNILEKFMEHDGYIINELIEKEVRKVDVSPEVLNREFSTLSNGERTKLMLVGMFLKKNNFLLIDEPTNHLDYEGRKSVANYLKSKNGFILVSHDRAFIDEIVDHILSINKASIEIQKGNFSSWYYNKELQDNYEIQQDEKIKKEIGKLQEQARRFRNWSDDIESTKFGFGPTDRGAIGARAARMMKKAQNTEKRREKAIEEKKKLLKNIERSSDLKIHQEKYFKDTLISVENLSINYGNKVLFKDVNFTVNTGDRIALKGINGSGKSSIIKLLLGENIHYEGNVNIGSNLKVSYISQDTSYMKGSFSEFIGSQGIDETLFRAILDKLDFNKVAFEKDISELSEGQKKKVLIAKSLCEKVHIHIWDEPLNYIDVISRIQIEKLINDYNPTLLFVEHDSKFCENIANKVVKINRI